MTSVQRVIDILNCPSHIVICPYCNQRAKLVSGKTIYPHRKDLWNTKIFHCEPCDARVGTHESGKPLGTMANAELRAIRTQAHRVFDQIWKKRYKTRSEAYYWLSNVLGISKRECHIGSFDINRCSQTIYHSRKFLNRQ